MSGLADCIGDQREGTDGRVGGWSDRRGCCPKQELKFVNNARPIVNVVYVEFENVIEKIECDRKQHLRDVIQFKIIK